MGLKFVRIGKLGRVEMLYRDWVIELCLIAWFGLLIVSKHFGWNTTTLYWGIFDFVITGTVFARFERMLPRRCWYAVTMYSLVLAVIALGFTAGEFMEDGCRFTRDVINGLIIMSIFLASASFGAFMWRRRVVRGTEILQRRALIAKRRRMNI